MQPSYSDDVPAIVERLALLRNLLRTEPLRIPEIMTLLEPRYLPGETGRRLVHRDLRSLEAMGYVVVRLTQPVRFALTSGPHVLADSDIDALMYIRDMFVDSHPLAPMMQQLLA